jgi:hypothetical protein
MPNRREFIQAGLAASIVPVAFPVRQAVASTSGPAVTAVSSHRLLRLVCDRRCGYSTDVAREAERLGINVVCISGDITDFWFDDLAPLWRASPAAIAGLTAHGPLFCLERFGWDHGLRVVFRGAHRLDEAGRVEHTLTGPVLTLASARAALTGHDWPIHVARLLSSCAVTHDQASTTVRSTIATERDVDFDDMLFSWVIAPKRA